MTWMESGARLCGADFVLWRFCFTPTSQLVVTIYSLAKLDSLLIVSHRIDMIMCVFHLEVLNAIYTHTLSSLVTYMNF